MNYTVVITTTNHGSAAPIIRSLSNPEPGYYGFGIDMLEIIFGNLGILYQVKMTRNNPTGQLVEVETGKWDGMIGEVLNGESDMALAALTMDSQRSAYVDFTFPFKSLGIGILYVSPLAQQASFFSCFQVFTLNTWLCFLASLPVFTIALYVFGRGRFSFLSSFWFFLCPTLRQAGPSVPHKSFASRCTAVIWWLFTLILATVFTANFTTFLAVPTYHSPIKGFEDLARQVKVKYGFHSTGSIGQVFQNSPREIDQKIWRNAVEFNRSQHVLFNKNDDGVRHVKSSNGSFAFIVDTPILEAAVANFCELAQAGETVNRKFWAIPLRKGSRLKSVLNAGIIHLAEHGVLDYLDRKWLNRGHAKICTHDSRKIRSLGLQSLGGVYVILTTGLGFSLLGVLFEILTFFCCHGWLR